MFAVNDRFTQQEQLFIITTVKLKIGHLLHSEISIVELIFMKIQRQILTVLLEED
jgi:hypothetical protein